MQKGKKSGASFLSTHTTAKLRETAIHKSIVGPRNWTLGPSIGKITIIQLLLLLLLLVVVVVVVPPPPPLNAYDPTK